MHLFISGPDPIKVIRERVEKAVKNVQKKDSGLLQDYPLSQAFKWTPPPEKK